MPCLLLRSGAADGEYVLVSRKKPHFYKSAFETGDEDTVTSAQGSAFRPQVSRDGTKLVYATRYDSETALRLRGLVTGEDRWLKSPVQHDDQESYFSSRDLLPGYAFLPDGKEIVISYGGKLHRLNRTQPWEPPPSVRYFPPSATPWALGQPGKSNWL